MFGSKVVYLFLFTTEKVTMMHFRSVLSSLKKVATDELVSSHVVMH